MSDISVVMATYNGARHIREQLLSICGQTEPPCEIIVSDDGSTDETLEIVDDVAQTTAVPIRVRRNTTNLGYADNFLRAAESATGRFVAFSDQDDRWRPTKLERSRRALAEHDAVMVTHPWRRMTSNGVLGAEPASGPGETIVVEPLTDDPFGVRWGFTMVLDADLLRSLPSDRRGPDTFDLSKVLSHDRWAFFLASNLGRYVVVDEPLVDYRQHPDQLFGARRVGIGQRVRNKMVEGPPRLQQLADVAGLRAELLASSPRHEEPIWQRAARRWTALRTHCQRRHDLYTARLLVVRLSLLARNVRAGAYRGFAANGLGPKRLVEDLTLGLAGPSLRRWSSRLARPRPQTVVRET